MKHKEHPVRGEILFSGIVAAEVPHEASFRFTVYGQGDLGCRVIYERGNVFAAFPMRKQNCDLMLDAFHLITQSLGDARDAYSEE
jgi:hypothetical protein